MNIQDLLVRYCLMADRGTDQPDASDQLADAYAKEYQRGLSHVARSLFWDWAAARQILRQTWEKAEANLHRYDPNLATLRGWVCRIRDDMMCDYMTVNGYFPPTSGRDLEYLYADDLEGKAAAMKRHASMVERINTLPPTLREAMHAWLADRPIDAAAGVRIRVGLKLLGRQRLKQALNALPEDKAAAVRAVYLDHSVADAAEHSGCSVSEAFTRARDGVRQLYEIMAA